MIPKCLHIAGMKWPVRLWKSVRHEGSECDGLCRACKQDILLHKGLLAVPDQLRKTLVHEAVHAMLYDSKHFNDEELVSLLAERIDSLLLNTPKFLDLYK